MDEFNSSKQLFKTVYYNGWFSYVTTITFKPGLPYCTLHPKKAHELFKTVFSTYTAPRGIRYYMCPELSANGNLHYHGIVLFQGGDYDAFEKKYKLFKNWLNRKFGRNYLQRIYSYFEPYKTHNIMMVYGKKEAYTSFEKIWNYIHKDQLPERRFTFLDRVIKI